jgi:hypothetical protein
VDGPQGKTSRVKLVAQKTVPRMAVLTAKTTVLLQAYRENLNVPWNSELLVMETKKTSWLRQKLTRYHWRKFGVRVHTHDFRKTCVTNIFEKTGSA